MSDSQNVLDNAAPSFEREMANYQAHVAKQSAAPSNSTVDPRYAKEQEAFATYQKSQPAERNEQPAAPVATSSSRDADVLTLQKTMAHINPETGKRYASDTRVQAVLERSLADVLSGKPLDRAALRAELGGMLGIKLASAAAEPASTEPVVGEGTPAERLTAEQTEAINTIMPHIDAEGGISGAHLPPTLTAGFVLPKDVVFDAEETLAMCALAKKAGFTQADVDRYIQAQR